MASKKRNTKTETKNAKRAKTLAEQTRKMQAKMLEQLPKYPIVQIACERVGIGRSTYYEWRENPEFKKASDAALQAGTSFINDLAESKVILGIQNDNVTFTIFWLKHRHDSYMEVLRHRHKHMHQIIENKGIDPEQAALIRRAMGNFATKLKKNEDEGVEPDAFIPKQK
jgi:hypothetical protein